MRTTPTCCSSRPPRWRHRRSTTARATDPHRRRLPAPRLPPLVAVIVAIALDDVAFLMLRFTRNVPLLRRGWFWLKIASSGRGALVGTRWAHFNCRDKNAPRSNPRRSSHDKGRMKLAEKTDNLQISLSTRSGASGASATAATSRSPSRLLVPCGAEPRVATEAPARSPSRPMGPIGSHVA
jgi:hypothetical protein